jgi:two-component system sensor histidine kinase FlrB
MKAATISTPEISMDMNKLEQAFDMFNQLSEDLGSSYRQLEDKVGALRQELAASNSARVRELTAKEQLAAKLSALMQALPGGVLSLDPFGKVQDENPAARDILGMSLIGQCWHSVLTELTSEEDFMEGEASLHNGKRISISSNAYGQRGDTIILLTDISENYRLGNLINREKRLTALGEMAARLAHQVRTPLSSAMLYLSHLSSGKVTAPEHNEVITNNIRNRLRQIEKLVEGMLSYIRGDIGANQSFSIDSLLKEVDDTSQPKLQEAKGSLLIDCPVQDLTMRGDKEALVNALLNLIDNAIEAAEEAPHITIGIFEADGNINIKVADNGRGISEYHKENIFDPFYSTREGGTGLGLAVVMSAVKAHRGEVSIENLKTGGTVFTLSLPHWPQGETEEIGIWASDPE